MNDSTRSGHHGGGQVTGETLRRLIEEGEPADGAPHDRPTDAALRDLAAALNIAASAKASPAREQAAQEAAALAAFRDAHPGATVVGRVRRRALRDHLCRARTAMLAGVTAAVLGGGAAVAAAGGGVPFVGGDADSSAAPSAPASDEPGPSGSGAPAAPAGQAQPAPAGTPSASASGADDGSGQGSGDDPTGEPDADASVAGNADESALRSLCTVHARNPHLTPRALVTAAGGPDRIGPYCETLLATPTENDGPGKKPGHDDVEPRPPAGDEADDADGLDATGGGAAGTADGTDEGTDEGKTKDRS